MPNAPDRGRLEARRQGLAQATAARRQAETTAAAQQRMVAQLLRTLPPDDPRVNEARAALDRAQRAAADARRHEQATRLTVTNLVAGWLDADPAADIAKLEAGWPIVLMPIRIETCFIDAPPELRVRVYPDEISADPHEPELSAPEKASGAAYWAAAQAAGGMEQLDAWRILLATYTAERTAWIVRATAPGAQPAAIDKPPGWSRAVEARLLPDRWIVVGYRQDKEVVRAHGAPIVDPLALSVAPDMPDTERVDVSGDGLTIDDAMRWTVEWARALAVGMGISVPLTAIDLQLGFDRLLVVGVKTSMSPATTADGLGALIDAHHYTRGLAFVPQATPTSNAAGTPAAYPTADPNGSVSFTVERGAVLNQNADGAGRRLTAALGVHDAATQQVRGAPLVEAAPALAMNHVLFPATLGYFFGQMMSPILSADEVDAIGQHMSRWVVPRGSLSAFRIERVPYAVLATTSLTWWQPDAQATPFDAGLPARLRTLRDIWKEQIASVPRVGRSADPDQDLLDLLSMEASAREVRVRRVIGEETFANLAGLFAMSFASWPAAMKAIAVETLNRLALSGTDPRVMHMTYGPDAKRYAGGLVDVSPVSETAPLANNYIDWIRTASIADLRRQALPAGFPDGVKQILLYRFLRHAALAEYHRWAVALAAPRPAPIRMRAPAQPWTDSELVAIVPGTESRPTPWQSFQTTIDGPTLRGVTIEDLINGDSEDLRQLTGVPDYRDLLAVLSPLPTAELERLFTESLDAASHRLDAWVSSLATKRLAAMRSRVDRRIGCFVGAYGWVENVRPAHAPTVALADGRRVRTTPGGYIHAPSTTHAATAAVLRNGYLTQIGQSDSPYAIDLSSARVRAARFVLDSVRNGQTIGAVLGYELERALHEREVETLIDPIRGAAPLVADKAFDSGEQTDLIAARNVVDGLLLRTKWKNGKLFGDPAGLPAAIAHRDVLEQELARLDERIDAVADVLLADAVHQVVRGSTTASSASLDALARGVRPPEPEVTRAPTGGITLTHRLAIVLDAAPLALAAGWPVNPTARAAAEPRLDAWAGAILGDPRQVRCRIRYPDVDPARPPHEIEVTFDRLRLRPLDVLAVARAIATQPQSAEIDRRVLFAAFGDAAPADAPPTGPFTVVYERAAGWDRATVQSVPELIDRANALATAIGGMRPLAPLDLVIPEQASSAAEAQVDLVELQGRVTAARATLVDIRTKLDAALAAVPVTTPPTAPTAAQAAAIRAQLRRAADFGIAAAFPPFVAGTQEGSVATMSIVAIGASVSAEAAKRQADYDKAAPGGGAPPAAQADDLAKQAAVLFGRDFVAVAGFTWTAGAAAGDELAQALAYGPTLVGAGARTIEQWLHQVTRVRPALGRWREMRLLAEAAGAPPIGWEVAQIPHAPAASWVALPPRAGEARVSGCVSLVLNRPSAPGPDTAHAWYGLFLDEWVEIIPNEREHTGIAFRYDDTGHEAAQAILVAVPPSSDLSWSFDALVAVVNETLELAKIRAVDAELLGALGQLLPAIYLAGNPSDDTISTKFVELVDDVRIDASRA